MVMVLTQVRLPKKMLSYIESFVKKGDYENKSDFIRDAVRKKVFEEQLRSVSLGKDSVNEVRRIREILSKEPFDLNEINSFG